MKESTTRSFGRLTLALLLGLGFSLSLAMLAGAQQALVSEPAAAPNFAPATDSAIQQSCTLPATVTTADELYDCITAANAGTGGTITLGADIDLTTLTTSPLPQITSTITLEGVGYIIDGGGSVRIFNVGSSGNLTVNQATLQNGSATYGGGIYNGGTLMVSNSTLSNNTGSAGGGIYNTVGTTTVTNSTISGNDAVSIGSGGGGMMNTNYGILTVSNSTFSGNTAPGSGSALFASDPSTVNFAGNIFAGGDNCDIRGTLNDNGYNLSDDGTCTNGGTGSATNATLNLSALSGGVHTPQPGSDAIGAIPNGTSVNNNGVTLACNGTTTDQLGSTRPINSGGDCTSGAVEVTPLSLSHKVYLPLVTRNGP